MPFSGALLTARPGGSRSDGCGVEPSSPLLHPAPEAEPAQALQHRDARVSKILGKSAGGSAIPSLHLLGTQLETLTEGTAKRPVPMPEGTRAPKTALRRAGHALEGPSTRAPQKAPPARPTSLHWLRFADHPSASKDGGCPLPTRSLPSEGSFAQPVGCTRSPGWYAQVQTHTTHRRLHRQQHRHP